MQKGTPPPPPAGGVKKGATPPPPPGPMAKKGAKKTEKDIAAAIAPKTKTPEPLSIKGTYSAARLAKETDNDLLTLFNDLLEALATTADFWSAKDKKPQLDWDNKINAVKKALLDPKRTITIDVNKAIQDRINQVRMEKAQAGQAQQAAVEKAKEKEKPKEEVSEPELIEQINKLLKKADTSDMLWLIQFKGIVRSLDTVNHDKALVYENDFIKQFPGQKPFLPKKKAVAIVKELTEEDKLVAKIDKIIELKPMFWNIAVREDIQQLYDMNQQRGLEYEKKVLDPQLTGAKKADKPFLKLKE
jgi:hypothetical protein